jgi:hypothetical protein
MRGPKGWPSWNWAPRQWTQYQDVLGIPQLRPQKPNPSTAKCYESVRRPPMQCFAHVLQIWKSFWIRFKGSIEKVCAKILSIHVGDSFLSCGVQITHFTSIRISDESELDINIQKGPQFSALISHCLISGWGSGTPHGMRTNPAVMLVLRMQRVARLHGVIFLQKA